MSMQSFYRKTCLFGFVVLSVFLLSCTSQRKTIYLQHLSAADSLIQNSFGQETYKVQPGDVLFIRVSSMNKDINEIFNSDDFVSGSNINEISLYYKGYLVNDDGTIEMPVLGKVDVVNKTLNEIQAMVVDKTKEYFKEVYITVKYGGFKVTVLGEVNKPGVFYYYNNKVNLLEAIGQAGDLTAYGNRQNILLLRNSSKGGISTQRVNLLDKDLLKSPLLYLQPNDVIYVEPVKSKNWKLNSSNVSIILSSISTLILVITFVLKIK